MSVNCGDNNNNNNVISNATTNSTEAVQQQQQQQSEPMSCPLMSRSDELSYVKALKSHQMSRLEHIRSETTKLRLYLETLRSEVSDLEEKQLTSREGVNWLSKLSTNELRQHNIQLRIECHCLSMEIDLYSSGQMPLGITDENFYNNIPAGPNGPLLPTINVPLNRPSNGNTNVGLSRSQSSCPPLSGHSHDSLQRPVQPPTYEESITIGSQRFGYNNSLSNIDILCQVPPAPRPVWLSPTLQQTQHLPHLPQMPLHCNSGQTPPVIPPRPITTSPRTPPVLPQLQTLNNQTVEEGQRWVCEKCTVENHPALAYCEVCEMPRNGYLGAANRA